jgi:predicted nicotinamide N-methyase
MIMLYYVCAVHLGITIGINYGWCIIIGALNVTITDKQIKMIHKNIDVNKNILTNVNVTVEKHEWGGCLAPSIFPPYDVILGADIIYIEDTYNDLIKSLKVLSNINSIVLLSVQERQNKVKTFLKLLDENHLSHSIIYSHGSVVIYQIIKTTNY